MKLGNYSFVRRYTLAQILVDIASFLVILLICYSVYVCAMDIEQIKSYNVTDTSLDFLDWKPLIIWCVISVVLFVFSFILILIPKKMPKKLVVTEKYAPKYCNILDTCISCVRLVLLLAVFELSCIHKNSILFQNNEMNIRLILCSVIIALLIWFTAVRLNSLSDVAEREAEDEKTCRIIEN